ncbi:unnamed protein product [Effrenium voratum]|nr:unnamed protein product [Effrenium voratum]CAJ1422968.1 unnamed protein product [Effrenium voratum]
MALKSELLKQFAGRMKLLGYGTKAIQKVIAPLAMKKPKKDNDGFQHVSPEEDVLMKNMHAEGMGIKKIASAIGRSTDTVSKHVFKKNNKKTKPTGRPVAISEQSFKQIQKVYQKLLRESKGKEVTVAMVKREMKLKCSLKTLSRAFWSRGIYFRPLYEKPDLSAADVKERKEWAEEHRHRSPQQWSKYVHAIIDNKTFQVYHTGKARDYAARRQVRGAYRSRRRVFTTGYTKPDGKVLMWHVTKGKWNGEAAEHMYSEPLRKALEKEYPHVCGSWRVMEDNDPSGYKCGRAMAAKSAAGIVTLDLPKRSPDLNPLDFSLWAAVNKKMREKESKWPTSKRETRAAYLARLRRTALGLSNDYINSIVGAMAGRVQQVLAAGGSHFPEGGLQS